MNILLSSNSNINAELLSRLAAVPEASIYLALSEKEALRIVSSVKPEIVVLSSHSRDSFVDRLSREHPKMVVYLYETSKAPSEIEQLILISNPPEPVSSVLAAFFPVVKRVNVCRSTAL